MTEILISEPQQREAHGKKPVWSRLLAWLVVLLLLVFSFLNMGRVAKTYFILYPADIARVADSENVRWSLSNLGVTKLISYLNANSAPDDGVFVFRMSDFGYYSHNQIYVFTDDTYADLFKPKPARMLARELRALGVKYVAAPPYAVAEINNSSFADLLADTTLTQIVFDDQANRLYELIDPVEAPELVDVWSSNMSAGDALQGWQLARLKQPINKALLTKPALIDRNVEAQSVSISREKPALARKDVVDVLQYSSLQPGLAPALAGQQTIEVDAGAHVFNAVISGEGEINLYLDVFEQAKDGPMLARHLLWSGVGTGATQDIGGQFILTSAVTEAGLVQSYDARPYFTLRQGGRLTLSEIAIRRLSLADQQQLNAYVARDRALTEGWSAPVNVATTGYTVAPNFGVSEAMRFSAHQTDSSGLRFSSPKFVPPSSLFESDARLKLEAASDQVSPKLRISAQVSGRGALRQSLRGECLGTGENIIVSLQSLSLSETTRDIENTVDLPCVPSGITIDYELRNDIFKSPPDLRFGELTLSDIEMSIAYWDNGVVMSESRLTRSKDIVLPVTPSVPVKPLYEDPA